MSNSPSSLSNMERKKFNLMRLKNKEMERSISSEKVTNNNDEGVISIFPLKNIQNEAKTFFNHQKSDREDECAPRKKSSERIVPRTSSNVSNTSNNSDVDMNFEEVEGSWCDVFNDEPFFKKSPTLPEEEHRSNKKSPVPDGSRKKSPVQDGTKGMKIESIKRRLSVSTKSVSSSISPVPILFDRTQTTAQSRSPALRSSKPPPVVVVKPLSRRSLHAKKSPVTESSSSKNFSIDKKMDPRAHLEASYDDDDEGVGGQGRRHSFEDIRSRIDEQLFHC